MVIRDGPIEMRSRMTFEPDGQGGTIIRGSVDIPAMKEPILQKSIEESLRRMKQLIESEG
jgi:hypothetical protein